MWLALREWLRLYNGGSADGKEDAHVQPTAEELHARATDATVRCGLAMAPTVGDSRTTEAVLTDSNTPQTTTTTTAPSLTLCHEVCAAGGIELPHVCAIVGGIIAQDILKVVSRKGAPMAGYFCFDGLTGAGQEVDPRTPFVEKPHPILIDANAEPRSASSLATLATDIVLDDADEEN